MHPVSSRSDHELGSKFALVSVHEPFSDPTVISFSHIEKTRVVYSGASRPLQLRQLQRGLWLACHNLAVHGLGQSRREEESSCERKLVAKAQTWIMIRTTASGRGHQPRLYAHTANYDGTRRQNRIRHSGGSVLDGSNPCVAKKPLNQTTRWT